MTTQSYWSSITVNDHGDTVWVGGYQDTIDFSRSSGNTVVSYGLDQTVSFDYSGANTVFDYGEGLNLRESMATTQLTVYDFQFDPTGTVTLAAATGVITPDGHGGSFLQVHGEGTVPWNGAKIDFVGDPNLTMAQVHSV